MLTHIDLFSGIGGFTLAAQWAGFKTVVFCENEPFCQNVLRKHWPEVQIVPDIQDFDGTQFRNVILLTAGVPCQPASVAGKRRGEADDRWLWPEAFRILAEAKPIWAIFENPCGILSLKQGVVFESLLTQMEGEGYEVWPIIIPACAVNAPHRRDRVWIIANSCQPGPQKLFKQRTQQQGWSGSHRIYLRRKRYSGDTSQAFIRRGDDGISNRVDRIKALGSAIVPQVAYEIIKKIAGIES